MTNSWVKKGIFKTIKIVLVTLLFTADCLFIKAFFLKKIVLHVISNLSPDKSFLGFDMVLFSP